MSACAMDVNNHKKDQAATNVENAFNAGGDNNALNALDILKADTKSICKEVNGVNTMGYIGQQLDESVKKALAPNVPDLMLYDSAKQPKS